MQQILPNTDLPFLLRTVPRQKGIFHNGCGEKRFFL